MQVHSRRLEGLVPHTSTTDCDLFGKCVVCTTVYNAVHPLCNFLVVVFTSAVVLRCTGFAECLAQAGKESTRKSLV